MINPVQLELVRSMEIDRRRAMIGPWTGQATDLTDQTNRTGLTGRAAASSRPRPAAVASTMAATIGHALRIGRRPRPATSLHSGC